MSKINPDWPRKIIHLDMDAFFAAVEQRDRPELRGKPVIVGGDPFGRGVVSTASYEARKFGIQSAMPASQARRLCPQAIFLRPSFEKYREVSHEIRSLFYQHTDFVEVVSVDEAYLDVSEHKLGIQDPVMVASLIKQNITARTQLTASAGVAPNLFLAKIASDFKKPDGLTVIAPDKIEKFLHDLPVRKIPGVGPVTERDLARHNIHSVGDLAAKDLNFLISHFGKMGVFLSERAQGHDDREVEPYTEPKQSSTEETFSQDLLDLRSMRLKLAEFAQEVFEDLKSSGRMGRTLVLKVKYFDFEVITRSKTLQHFPENWEEVYEIACELLETKTHAGRKAIRLLGLGISGLESLSESPFSKQKELFT